MLAAVSSSWRATPCVEAARARSGPAVFTALPGTGTQGEALGRYDGDPRGAGRARHTRSEPRSRAWSIAVPVRALGAAHVASWDDSHPRGAGSHSRACSASRRCWSGRAPSALRSEALGRSRGPELRAAHGRGGDSRVQRSARDRAHRAPRARRPKGVNSSRSSSSTTARPMRRATSWPAPSRPRRARAARQGCHPWRQDPSAEPGFPEGDLP